MSFEFYNPSTPLGYTEEVEYRAGVTASINTINSEITTINSEITALEQVTGSVDLSALTTTDKTSLVNAINENVTNIATNTGNITTNTNNITNLTALLNSEYVNAKYPPVGLTACVGDGVANDTTAMQALINYCETNNKILYVPSGYYLITSTLTISKPYYLTMVGQAISNKHVVTSNVATFIWDGNGSAIQIGVKDGNPDTTGFTFNTHLANLAFKIKTGNVNTNNAIYIVGVNNCILENISIDGTWNNCILTDGGVNGMIIKGCSLHGAAVAGINLGNSTETVFGNNVVKIIDNEITDCNYGIRLCEGRTNWIENNDIENNDYAGYYFTNGGTLESIVIKDNYHERNRTYDFYSDKTDTTLDIIIEDNSFYGTEPASTNLSNLDKNLFGAGCRTGNNHIITANYLTYTILNDTVITYSNGNTSHMFTEYFRYFSTTQDTLADSRFIGYSSGGTVSGMTITGYTPVGWTLSNGTVDSILTARGRIAKINTGSTSGGGIVKSIVNSTASTKYYVGFVTFTGHLIIQERTGYTTVFDSTKSDWQTLCFKFTVAANTTTPIALYTDNNTSVQVAEIAIHNVNHGDYMNNYTVVTEALKASSKR